MLLTIGFLGLISCASDDGPPEGDPLNSSIDETAPDVIGVDEVIRFRTEDSEDLWGQYLDRGK